MTSAVLIIQFVATMDFVLLWITLFLCLQSCVAVCDRQIRRRRLSYDVLHQRCLPSKASRRTCVSCVGTWGRYILIGNRIAIYSISEGQKIHSGISARPMASILRKPLPNCDIHLFQQRGSSLLLHWLAQASSFSELAALYAIGKSTVATIVHEDVTILRERLVPEVILFPTGQELD